MIPRLTRVTESVAAGVVGVALPISLALRPLSITAAVVAVQGAILSAAVVHRVITRRRRDPAYSAVR